MLAIVAFVSAHERHDQAETPSKKPADYTIPVTLIIIAVTMLLG